MHRDAAVQSVVEVQVGVTGECRLLESIMRALTPDNRVPVRNMSITESFERSEGDLCTYTVKVSVYAENSSEALKRARATVNDLLLALKVISSTRSALKA